ncbi:receptor-like protein kinase [Striga asiatica]|uniref:Receptor-like protein kinase n=1 Tax=Striga asiatica TaxID=4170 RepID=A0A5A7PPR6_STRAF|nr:receptor-like protein kinase [Striga asiatica]
MQRLNSMLDVARALEYLHCGLQTAVVHCDLKPSNVLLDVNMVSHVSDFGVSKMMGEDQSFSHTKTLATYGYIAPEYGLEGLVSTKCDVYSYGIMVMETFSAVWPWDEMFDGKSSLRSWVRDGIIVDGELLSSEDKFYDDKLRCLCSVMELALSCCVDNPEDRIVMADAVGELEKIKLQFLACSSTRLPAQDPKL